MEPKAIIRNQIKELKKQLDKATKDEQANEVFSKIERMPVFIESKIIVAYWAMPDELPTQSFIEKWHKAKLFLLPVIEGEDLFLKKYTGIDSMKKHVNFNVLEPTGDKFPDENLIDLIIVPGIAFDKQNNRLGRGRGFYDRLLGELSVFKIGIGFSFQLIKQVPTNFQDIPMNQVITS